jgi:hypothetical protein
VLFAYASDNAAAREANDELESRYDPFYVLAAAERLLAETGGSEETGSPSPPDSDAGDAASPAR